MDLNLTGRVALITGAGQGVGRGIALTLAAEGCAVAVNDLFPDRANAVADDIRALGGTALAVPADVCDAGAVASMVAAVQAGLGAVHILVNNAGVPPALRADQQDRPLFHASCVADQLAMVALNLHGTLYCCRAVLPGMVAAHRGRILNIVSEAGRAGEARLATYAAAKAGVIGFTRALAQEHGGDAITVNAIALGAVSHEGIHFGPLAQGTDTASDPAWQKMARRYPMARGLGRLGLPQDVADAVAFLASDRAAFVTGQTLGVSGGYYMP